MNKNTIILFVVVVMVIVVVLIVYWRSFKLERFENKDTSLAEEEFYNRVSKEVAKKMESSGKKTTCVDRIKLVDNKMLKDAYMITGSNKDACYNIAQSMCEVVNPAIFKGSNKTVAPVSLKNTALPTQIKLDCFQMHYDCCVQGASGEN